MSKSANISARFGARHAFSLIEVMVAVTLMSVIVLGLLTMFSQTQRAFRAGMTQVDVMESGRAACEMIAREMEATTPTRLPERLNFYTHWSGSALVGGDFQNGYALFQTLPGKSLAAADQWRTNVIQDVIFTARENQTWQGIGYRVQGDSMVGTLYRYETDASALDTDLVGALAYNTFFAKSNRVIDGVVHFRVVACDGLGAVITPYSAVATNTAIGVTNNVFPGNNVTELIHDYHFRSNAVPAFVEVELGILENKVAERCRNLPLTAQAEFLKSKAGNVQIFRQRVPIHNVDPSVYQ